MAFTGPNGALQLFGITLIGATPENGRKLLLTGAIIIGAVLLSRLIRYVIRVWLHQEGWPRAAFWLRQAVAIVLAVFVVVTVASIWFDDPERLTAAVGLVTAGLAFAMQRVVTAVAGYIVILRGKTFNVGDRISMGGVRGDVIALDFTQTTIMEMGQTGPRSDADPEIWVRSRQYTGRIVTVTNAKIFEEPVYNFSREFPFLFDEMSFGIPYNGDLERAEKVLLEVAAQHALPVAEMGKDVLAELQRRYFMTQPNTEPRVYWRATDNWVSLTLRFLVQDRGIREIKDGMTRDILKRFAEAKIEIASTTFEIVGLPPVQVQASLTDRK
jgi:small-conductance mechanosensitive channel